MTTLGQLKTGKPIENAMKNIKEWLDRIEISGLDLDMRYDARQNVALLRLKYKNQNYEFRSTNQSNCRLNMHGIARVMEFKVRGHLMGIEDFGKSMKAYLQLEAPQGYNSFAQDFEIKSDERSYAILGLTSMASNEEIKKRYKELCKTYHPDMALSDLAKKEFERKIAEINDAHSKIKSERGIS